MKTKTFKEVIRDIKKGETWETVDKGYVLKSITYEEDSESLEFYHNNSILDLHIDPNQEFVLKIKSYDFDEAYIELLNGGIIESESGNIFFMKDEKMYKVKEGSDILYTDVECFDIECTDILGKWYIYTER